jgi:hypothetical protein
LPNRNLGQDRRCGTETIEADASTFAGQAQGAPVNQAGAQQRCYLDSRKSVGQGEAIPRIGDRMRRIAAVEGGARKLRVVAEVLGFGTAIEALAAGESEPRNADALPRREALHLRSNFDDATDNLMFGHDRKASFDLFVADMEIGASDAAGSNFEQDLKWSRNGHGPLDPAELAARTIELHRDHALCFRHPAPRQVRRRVPMPSTL